jgi:hypothetical protein
MAQKANVTTPNAPPFASPSGEPRNQGQTVDRPADLLAKPNGTAMPAGGRDFAGESSPQKSADEEERKRYVAPQNRSRAQTPGSVEQRVNPATIAKGGPTVADTPSVARSGQGSIGASGRPFKNLR